MGEFTERAKERLREAAEDLREAEAADKPDSSLIRRLEAEVARRKRHLRSVQAAENL